VATKILINRRNTEPEPLGCGGCSGSSSDKKVQPATELKKLLRREASGAK
jgi:hypothetical protein